MFKIRIKACILAVGFLMYYHAPCQDVLAISYTRYKVTHLPANNTYSGVETQVKEKLGSLGSASDDSLNLIFYDFADRVKRKKFKPVMGEKIIHHATLQDYRDATSYTEVNYQNRRNILIKKDFRVITWTYTDSVKTILGYSCKFAISQLSDNEIYYAWFTDKVPGKARLFFPNLPGVVLEAANNLGGSTFIYEANDVFTYTGAVGFPKGALILTDEAYKEKYF